MIALAALLEIWPMTAVTTEEMVDDSGLKSTKGLVVVGIAMCRW